MSSPNFGESPDMNTIPFQKLMKQMPRIADAVNAFKSDEVQRDAFLVMIAALNNDSHVAPSQPKPSRATSEDQSEPEEFPIPKNSPEDISVIDDDAIEADITDGGSIHSFLQPRDS